MPANTAMPMFLVSFETECTYGNMAESEILCVRKATVLETSMQAYYE